MKPSIRIRGTSYIYAAFLLLILPLEWLLAAIIAAVFHEICHYFAVIITGNDVFEIIISNCGMTMKTTPLSLVQEFFCALAGPAGSVALFCCSLFFPRVGLCAGIQGLFNLLPIYPLDGGRACHAALQILYPAQAIHIFRWLENLLILCMILFGISFAFYLQIGFGPIFLLAVCLSRRLAEKFLANRGN